MILFFGDRVFLCPSCCPGSHQVEHAGFDSQSSSCFCLLNSGIKGLHHHAWPKMVSEDGILLILADNKFGYHSIYYNILCVLGNIIVSLTYFLSELCFDSPNRWTNTSYNLLNIHVAYTPHRKYIGLNNDTALTIEIMKVQKQFYKYRHIKYVYCYMSVICNVCKPVVLYHCNISMSVRSFG